MKEIKYLGTRPQGKDMKKRAYCVFECPVCKRHVEKFRKEGRKFKTCSIECKKIGSKNNITPTKHRKPLVYAINENGCFVVTSHAQRKGYTNLVMRGKHVRSHRFIYEECFGPIPDGLIVRHKCDNRACINPEHLELGTHQDNMEDMKQRDRSSRGSRHGHTKLNEQQVLEMKKLQGKMSITEVAKKFDTSIHAIYKIWKGESWKHVKVSESKEKTS